MNEILIFEDIDDYVQYLLVTLKPKCHDCKIEKTPQWRKDGEINITISLRDSDEYVIKGKNKIVCNACGLRKNRKPRNKKPGNKKINSAISK